MALRVRANDEPHGIFFLNPEQQAVVVMGSGPEASRALVVNVSRLAGLFGNATVGYKISGAIEEVMDLEDILGGQAEGRLFFREGQTVSAVAVPIDSQVGMLVQRCPLCSYLGFRFRFLLIISKWEISFVSGSSEDNIQKASAQ